MIERIKSELKEDLKLEFAQDLKSAVLQEIRIEIDDTIVPNIMQDLRIQVRNELFVTGKGVFERSDSEIMTNAESRFLA